MSSSLAMKFCFNSNCKLALERPRKGWRRRSGEFAELCDRCASAYEERKFCETFHLNASGWRCCESCGKQIHCGCIVSFHMFVLLDAGGIECITCARKSFILTPNPAWPPPSLFLPVHSDRITDLSSKNWCNIAGTGPVPWRQAPSFFGSSCAQSDLHPRMPTEVDMTIGVNKLTCSERSSVASFDQKKLETSERLTGDSLKLVPSELHNIGNLGTNCAKQSNSRGNVLPQSFLPKKDTSSPPLILPISSASPNDTKDPTAVSSSHVLQPISPYLKGNHCSEHHRTESSGEAQTRNAKSPGDARVRNHVLPRYWPRISDKELQQISGNSNSVITPLFEKMLSASDAGRIGRLVLPKKCAEAYFPPISQPEGLPLIVKDLTGKEWTFQFRFWPNNNSRMYVLEGVTPCIQSMQLQAGDIVTFSRIEPEGKLVMGFRKASTTSPSDQGGRIAPVSNGASTNGDVSSKSKPCEGLCSYSESVDQANLADQASPWSKDVKPEYTDKEVLGAKSAIHNKRKNITLGSKSKRLRIEREDLIELKLTWEQAQVLLRPPSKRIPNIVVVEGFEFEEYEQDAPVIGRPTIAATDSTGENIQWAQCEDCLKWRRVPVDASLSSRWTCSENLWDLERSSCLIAQELTAEQLQDLLLASDQTASKNMKAVKEVSDPLETLDGFGALASLAVREEGDGNPLSSQATTKHPRHRPGCTCIVCIQPPSGKGFKHRQTCTCNVCSTVKRRFQTLMTKREKKQSENEAEIPGQKLPDHQSSPRKAIDDKMQACPAMVNSGTHLRRADDDGNLSTMRSSSLSPFKGQIDLNIQPERDEEVPPGSGSGELMKLIQNTAEIYLRQQTLSSSSNRNLSSNLSGGNVNGNGSESPNRTDLASSHWDSEGITPLPFSDNARASSSATER